MAVYAITGKLGSGKGKGAMKLLRDYLNAGKRVATNCDIFMEHMMPSQSRLPIVRIPDKPTASDFYAIGSGNRFVEFDPIPTYTKTSIEFTPPSPRLLPGFDERHNGALFLDECASWLNTRNFQDKSRASLLEWAIHARKYGWDVYFICQNIKQIDAQLRESLFEYTVRMNRLDRMKIPFVSAGLKLMTAGFSDGSMPRVHIGVVRLGSSPDGLVADRWIFRGDDLNNSYNTTQVFSDSYPHAIHSMLSSWHLSASVGLPKDFCGPVRPNREDEILLQSRPLPPKPPHKHMSKFLAISLFIGLFIGAAGMQFVVPHFVDLKGGASAVAGKPKKYAENVTGRGYFQRDGLVTVVLSDGRSLAPMAFRTMPSGWEAQIADDLWVKGGAQ